jgi:hypothetical protein
VAADLDQAATLKALERGGHRPLGDLEGAGEPEWALLVPLPHEMV